MMAKQAYAASDPMNVPVFDNFSTPNLRMQNAPVRFSGAVGARARLNA